MIVIHTGIPFGPNRYDETMDAVQTLAEQSRRENGSIRDRAMVDIDDSTTVRFFEQYEDEAARIARTETKHYHAFVDCLPDFVDGQMETVNIVGADPEIHQFTVSDLATDDF